jgi:hypothetical protein
MTAQNRSPTTSNLDVLDVADGLVAVRERLRQLADVAARDRAPMA